MLLAPMIATATALVLAAGPASAALEPSALAGAWTVDLSAEPGSPYLKPMHLELRADGTVAGDFYESTIEAGRWKAARGRLCASFRTSDGKGPYHSTVCVAAEGRLTGQTWAEHRNFVFLWDASRPVPGR